MTKEKPNIALFDMSNVVFGTAVNYHHEVGGDIDLPLLRHIILNTCSSIRKKIGVKLDEVVFCFDSKHYWRRSVFEHYKAHRKKDRDDDSFDWDQFFKDYAVLKEEFKSFLPIKNLEVLGAEADDIIAVLAKRLAPHYNVTVVSSDTDFVQLQHDTNVKQWSPHHKKFVTLETAKYSLLEHVLRGDAGDGIPNFLSDGDSFVAGKRQKSLRADRVEECAKSGISKPEVFCRSTLELNNFQRNHQLISFECIPEDLAAKIVEAYETTEVVRGKVHGYLVANKLAKIMAQGGL